MNPGNATAIEAGGVGNGEDFEVGKMYEVKLTTGIEFKGIVLAYDSHQHVVIFQEGAMPETGKSMTTRTVNAKFISEARFMRKFNDPLASNKKKRFVDLNGLLEKEAVAIRKMKSIGVGVTEEAQGIFHALASSFRVTWDNKVIVVMGDVRICSPYHSDCVTGGTRGANDEVKKVLKNVREMLHLSSDA